MPELPEVEVVCRGLRPYLIQRSIVAVHWSDKDLRVPLPRATLPGLIGQRITRISRRAKYLLIHLANGSLLIVHLGMSGRLGIFPANEPVHRHDHVRWLLDTGLEMRLNDTRRFGSVHLLPPDEAGEAEHSFFHACGPEPLSRSCSPEQLQRQAHGRKQAIKTLLMDSRFIAGVGNIYANEALFAAGIHPDSPAHTLDLGDWQRLLDQLRIILDQAIACGGSTISDFLGASGDSGYFQVNFKVYGRTNQNCPNCGQKISKTRTSGRASFFCPSCQQQKKEQASGSTPPQKTESENSETGR